MDRAEPDRRFGYHRADAPTGAKHEAMRRALLEVAIYVDDVLPDGREKSLTITALEEAMFWAGAGIARPPA